jgi:type II secretory pathway pseudopilin PulG
MTSPLVIARRVAVAPRRIARVRDESGLGLLELLIALTILNIGLLALVSVFISSGISLRRASKTGTAGALAEQQMELYRTMKYCQIALTGDSAGQLTSTPASPYPTDVAYSATQVTTALSNSWCAAQTPAQNPPYTLCLTTVSASPTPALNSCTPGQTVTGADGHAYRVDTYVVLTSGGSASTFVGRQVKQVTVVVRDATSTTSLARAPLARDVSTFDALTGS